MMSAFLFAVGQVANYHRLLLDVEEEARALDDYVEALAEVKMGHVTGSTNHAGTA